MTSNSNDAFKEFDAIVSDKYKDALDIDDAVLDIQPKDIISTGILSLDIASGTGGLVRGRLVDLYGPEASGKSMLAYHIMGEALKTGGRAMLLDVEGTANLKFMDMLGLNTKNPNFRVIQGRKMLTGEQWIDILEKALITHSADVITLDSIPALVPQDLMTKDAGESKKAALQAQLLSERLPKVVGLARESKALVILINQLRAAPMQIWGNPEKPTGGNAIKFYASYRLEVKPYDFEKGKIHIGAKTVEQIIGHWVRYKFAKNKLAPYDTRAEIYVDFSSGIDYVGDMIKCAIQTNVIGKRGTSHYIYPNDENAKSINGNKAMRDYIVENNLFDELREQVLARVRTENTKIHEEETTEPEEEVDVLTEEELAQKAFREAMSDE